MCEREYVCTRVVVSMCQCVYLSMYVHVIVCMYECVCDSNYACVNMYMFEESLCVHVNMYECV